MEDQSLDSQDADGRMVHGGAALGRLYRRWQNWITVGAATACVLLLIVTAARIIKNHQTPGPFDEQNQGFCDFQNGVYYPSLAFRRGLSPYGQEYNANYPVVRSIPFFSPVILAFHVPFTLLPLHLSEMLYFVWLIMLILAISCSVGYWVGQGDRGGQHPANRRPAVSTLAKRIRWDVAALTALGLIVTRGGQQTIFTGYFTFELVLASLIAVHYGQTRPWVSACALVLVSGKPNYVLPIGILMLCRGNIKAICYGGVMSIGLALLGFAWILPDNGPAGLLEQIQQTQEIHRGDEIERPVNTWLRVDLLAIAAKWLRWDPTEGVYLITMFGMLLPAGWLLWLYHRRTPDPGTATGLSGGLLLLTSTIAVYHHVYDVLCVVAVTAALLAGSETPWSRWSLWWRVLLAGGLLLPGVNYVSSQKFLQAFSIDGLAHRLITSVNAVGLAIVWFGLLIALWFEIRRIRDQADRVSREATLDPAVHSEHALEHIGEGV